MKVICAAFLPAFLKMGFYIVFPFFRVAHERRKRTVRLRKLKKLKRMHFKSARPVGLEPTIA